MAQPYVGEIRMFAGNFAPAGWLFCAGQTLPISENDVLFQLIGTTYGGDGEVTFNLPNLQSRIPIHRGNGPDGVIYPIGEAAGVESVTLTTQQIPAHNHPLLVSNAAGTLAPGNSILTVPSGSQGGLRTYNNVATPNVTLHPQSVGPVGGSQPHDNMQPYLCVNFIISLFGLFPSPT
ncbi:MAG TPA: tail fiber protein [Allosphingosinicella sp.]|jgi:microcystin-dependent protein